MIFSPSNKDDNVFPKLHPGVITHLHDVVVDSDSCTFEDAEVSLRISSCCIVIGIGVVRRAVEEDAGATVVFDYVVVDKGSVVQG